jgi:hypothetical protein
MGGVAKWPLLVPLYRDDPVAQHMLEARNCLKTWSKPALIMFGDQGNFIYQGGVKKLMIFRFCSTHLQSFFSVLMLSPCRSNARQNILFTIYTHKSED